MNTITTTLSTATTLFGVAATLAILVTGFFLGRHWLEKAGYEGTGGDEEWGSIEHYRDYQNWRSKN